MEEVILSSDDEKDSKAKLRKKIQEIESRDKAADNEDNRSRVTDSKRSRSRDKSTKKQKRYSPEYSPDKSHKSKRSKR